MNTGLESLDGNPSMAEEVFYDIGALDKRMSEKVYRLRFHRLLEWMIFVPAVLFGSYVQPILILSVVLFMDFRFGIYIVACSVFTVLLTESLKYLFHRSRPLESDVMNRVVPLRKGLTNPAFPSGDSAQAAVIAGIIYSFTKNCIAFIIPLPTMFARVYFGAHWIGDTIGGYIIGIAVSSFIVPIGVHSMIELEIDVFHLRFVCCIIVMKPIVRIVCHVVLSKLFLFVLFSLFVSWNQPFDKSVSLLLGNSNTTNYSLFHRFILASSNWDGIHFVSNAKYGYRFDQNHAFLPLFPWMIRGISTIVCWLFSMSKDPFLYILIGNGVNFFLFLGSSILFHSLSRIVLMSSKKSWTATLLFIYNPATAHFSAVYSENLYTFLSFLCMLLYVKSATSNTACGTRLCVMTFLLFLLCLTRSNGVLLSILFLIPTAVYDSPKSRCFYYWMRVLVLGVFSVCSFLVYLYWSSTLYCPSQKSVFLQMIGCEGKTLYSFVEEKYWNVGFFRYYSLNHIPDFIIAFPTIALAVRFAYSARRVCFSFLLPFWIHLLLILTICVTTANVQIVTRMLLSTCPLFIWSATESVGPLVIAYWVLYCYVGYVVFSLFLPWT